MFEFLSSPFGLVAVGLGVLAVAVLALCLWITTLDRRMRGMADGLEAERRKVAEMQMVIGRRNNAARSYGRRGGPASAAGMTGAVAPAPAPAPAPAAARPSSPTVFFFIQKPPVICFFSIYYPDRPSVNRECENPRKNLPPERGRATPPG